MGFHISENLLAKKFTKLKNSTSVNLVNMNTAENHNIVSTVRQKESILECNSRKNPFSHACTCTKKVHVSTHTEVLTQRKTYKNV